MSAPPGHHHVWRAPVAIGVASSVGLVAGLVADGWGDVVSWIGLGLPLVVLLRYAGWRRRRH
jgi:hypothetical protein